MWYTLCCCVKASEADYDIVPIVTNEELEGEPYFNLMVEPSRKQFIKIEVRNNTDMAVAVHTDMYTVIKNEDDNLEYIYSDDQMDSAEKKLSELLTGDTEVIIPGQKDYLFQFTVSMPAEGLVHQMAGALVFFLTPERQEEDSEEHQTAGSGMQLPEGAECLGLNADTLSQADVIREGVKKLLQDADTGASVSAEFSYVIPLILKAGESAVSPALTLNDILVEDYEHEIKAIIQNKTPISADQTTINATVRKKGKKKIFFEVSKKNIDIPAHLDYELSIPSKGKAAMEGEYTVQIKLTAANAQWQWEKDFTISEKKKNDIIQNEMYVQKTVAKSRRYYLVIIPAILSVVITICIILHRKKRIEEEAVIRTIKDIKKNI